MIARKCFQKGADRVAFSLCRSKNHQHRFLQARFLSANKSVDNNMESHAQQSNYHPPLTSFSEDERMIQEVAQSWARQDLAPIVRDMDTAGKLFPNILQGLFDNGFMGMEIPEHHGGSGLSFLSACLVVEEISRVDPSVSLLVDIHNTLTNNAVRFWGSNDLQERWLTRLATDTVSSFCLSEAGSGSDAFAMKTTAQRVEGQNYYTLNGTKLWISSAQQAGVFLIFANANPSAGYKGITAFMVDAQTPGLTVGPPEEKLGLRASSTCPVIMDNVQVSVLDRLGEEGQGYKYCIEILNEGRIGIAAQQIGIAKACLYDIAMPYLQERHQFGQAIGDFQGMQHQYAQMATSIEAASLLTYNACRRKQHGQSFVKEGSMAKLYASQVAEMAASVSSFYVPKEREIEVLYNKLLCSPK